MSFVVPTRPQTHTLKEQQSKFISIIFPYDDVSEFKSCVSELRKKYHNASHVCWAYRIFTENQLEENSSDAGEPSGTAGLPILNAMKQKGFMNCGLAVVRYFGGTKLGKRGLIETYGNSARKLVEEASCKNWVKLERYTITAPMDFYGALAQSISRLGGKIIDDQSGELLKWNIEVQSGNLNELIQTIRTVTKGEGDFEKI
ncbi:MAG: YigZ family protein [Candidatus Neomarinimicrobiota bacterium]|nr:YigZ family protein [Candidatus Neomarinimicrobiota bacterium]